VSQCFKNCIFRDSYLKSATPNFQAYLTKHYQRIPDYQYYQQLGIVIGSGDVESKIKQVGARVKLSGARWHLHNVSRILRLRCAYLNHSPLLSVNVLS
jgi:hypothetical protein